MMVITRLSEKMIMMMVMMTMTKTMLLQPNTCFVEGDFPLTSLHAEFPSDIAGSSLSGLEGWKQSSGLGTQSNCPKL